VSDVAKAVTACGEAARDGARSLAAARDEAIDEALRGMAARLGEAAGDVLAANAADSGCSPAPRSRPARRRSATCRAGCGWPSAGSPWG
jgi:hypothetical protein